MIFLSFAYLTNKFLYLFKIILNIYYFKIDYLMPDLINFYKLKTKIFIIYNIINQEIKTYFYFFI